MLFIKYELYDLHSVICNIRFVPMAPENEKILQALYELFSKPQTDNIIRANQVRHSLAELDQLDPERWEWVRTFNLYVYGLDVIDDIRYSQVLLIGLKELLLCVQEKNEKRIFDCADAMHNVPVIIADSSDPKKDILFEIGSYSKKWNPDFYSRMKACLSMKKRKEW